MTSKNGSNQTSDLTPEDVLGTDQNSELREIRTKTDGPAGIVPFTADFLTNSPSGDHFGMSQNAGMGWNPAELMRKQFIILATAGGLREEDGTPVALGLHTGHFELSSMVKAAANEFDRLNGLPFATFCSDPMRRTHPRHHRHDGLPPIPQRCRPSLPPPSSLATNRPRSNGHRILRQRPPRYDDGRRRTPR